jgi:hypothetical protein
MSIPCTGADVSFGRVTLRTRSRRRCLRQRLWVVVAHRLLYRLSHSPHADSFVLKGAMLMMSWVDDPHRLTRDLDVHAREMVIAEEFQAMVALGRANSRMKDFYDIWVLSRSFSFEGDRLARAIAATFSRRGTEIPAESPDALTRDFAEDEQKQRQWRTFAENVATDPGPLWRVLEDLAAFLMPAAGLARDLGDP